MRKLLWLLALPMMAQAAGEGAWQDSSIGLTLNNRGVAASSRPLSAKQPVSGLMTLVVWRYELNGPIPAGCGCGYAPRRAAPNWTAPAAAPMPSTMCPPPNRCALSGKYPAGAV